MAIYIPTWFLYIIAGLMGAILGSFANVCILRIPKGQSIVRPRSHCPKCRKLLKPWHNIPVISFIVLGGKCAYCRKSISILYPLIELLCIVLSIVTWWHFKSPLLYFIYYLLFIVPLVIISLIDLRHMIIPDEISIPGVFVGIVVHTLLKLDGSYLISAASSVGGALLGGAVLFGIAYGYEKLKKVEGLGGGDVKLIAMLGAFLGYKSILFILLLSSILGSMVGIFMMLFHRKGLKYALPYGPFIALAGVIYLFFGERFISLYRALFV